MKYFGTKNLTLKSVAPVEPWTFQCPPISDIIRYGKDARQAWYRNPNTEHQFYTGYEAFNSRVRIGGDNPPHSLAVLVVDVDSTTEITKETILAQIKALPYTPKYLEKSLGHGWRLHYPLSEPVRWAGQEEVIDVCMDTLHGLLGLGVLPGVDKGSWGRPTQLYCNGGEWEDLGGEPIKASLVETALFDSVKKVCKRKNSSDVDLGRIATLIKKKWPEWDWPGDFVKGSQGPSWWVEGSTSTKSAIVHPGGMYTFADHADQDFYSWESLLGVDAIEQASLERIAKVIEDLWTDNKQFYRPRAEGGYEDINPQAFRRVLISRGLSPRATKKNPLSEVDVAMTQVETLHRVDYVAPFIYRKPGKIWHNDATYLNTSGVRAMEPAEGPAIWGPDGQFPFISGLLDRVFVSPEQLEHFLLWWHWAYSNALDGTPEQGQGIIIMGGPSLGKTLLNNEYIGPSLGGSENAVRFLMNEDGFGGHLFRRGYWTIDDSTMTASIDKLRKFTGAFKRCIANSEHEFHLKFGTPCRLLWLGRIGVTCNIDMYSKLIIPSLEESIMDKLNFYRWIDNAKDSPENQRLPENFFPRRRAILALRDKELPYLMRYIYDLQIPDRWRGDSRFGIKSFQDDTMITDSFLNSGAAAVQELLSQFMEFHIAMNESPIFVGTTTRLLTAIYEIPALAPAAKNLTVDGLTRRLAQMSDMNKSGVITSTQNSLNMRTWKIDWTKNEGNLL